MNNETQTIFNQITSFIPWYEFDKCVKRYKGNYKIKTFKCKHQFLAILFAQLTYQSSLRNIESCLFSQKESLYHIGFGKNKNISRTTLSKANEVRNYKIYEDFALFLINKAKRLYRNEPIIEDKNFNFEKSIYALDSSIVKVALSLMPWAKYMSNNNINKNNEFIINNKKYEYKNIGAVKLHTLLDLRGNIPIFNIITNGRVYDAEILDYLLLETGSFYIMDRGYLDYDRLFKIEENKSFFITRTCLNKTKTKRISSRKIQKGNKFFIDKENNIIKGKIICDQIVKFKTKTAKKDYPNKLRRIKYRNLEKSKDERDKVLIFLTNNFSLNALQITRLYKKRWEIELFFKWIKQHLRIKRFYSYSLNGIKTQIWIATCTYLLITIIKKTLNLKQSLNTILQVLSINIFVKTPINRLFEEKNCENNEEKNPDLFNYAD